MPIKIKFDAAHVPETPTFVLANRRGEKFGILNAVEINTVDSLSDANEISFKVYKPTNNFQVHYETESVISEDGTELVTENDKQLVSKKDNPADKLWSQITDFKLLWCKEYDTWYQITVELSDTGTDIYKIVSCVQLGQAELSQIMLYDIEINTEDDIAREAYTEPTILYNENNKEASLLHRILGKAPHYTIAHVDPTIKKIQRTFSFNGKSIYDALLEIAEEIGALVVLESNSTSDGKINRIISLYDLQSYCYECGYRGEFTYTCPSCGSHNITEGYGDDTTIFITSDELGEDIKFVTDGDSVKNNFKLEAGDDLMTATIRSCNANGTDYIWYISDDQKVEMSADLVNGLAEYDNLYDYYQTRHVTVINGELLEQYNALVRKYHPYNEDLREISEIVGYPDLIKAYYDVIDFELYLQSTLMPSIEIAETNAKKECKKLYEITKFAVQNLSTLSFATANSNLLSLAKAYVDPNFKVEVNGSSLEENVWTGSFTITHYSDDEDTFTSDIMSIAVTDEYESFIRQKIEKLLKNENYAENYDIEELFKRDIVVFKSEIKKYALNRLTAFYDACQSCIDVLIEQGIADGKTWSSGETNLYDNLYIPYLEKHKALEAEIKLRESEIDTIAGIKDENGNTTKDGMATEIVKIKNGIQSKLNLENVLGTELWLEFVSFRRDDKYTNSNYVSDGLNNSELFEKANEFLKVAREEIYKSAEKQHSITSTLKNLLTIKRFEPLTEYFSVGNWMRIRIDETVYKLRLLSYSINYDNLNNIDVEFSDVTKTINGYSDQRSIIEKAQSMATTYDTVAKQATQGKESKSLLEDWVNKGLSTTTMKIVNDADNQNITYDSHGILCREYNNIADEYEDEQIKIINKGLYTTDDGWQTAKAGIGKFTFWNPKTEKWEEAYGVIADKLVGNFVLSEDVGIYNQKNSITLNEDGIVVTSNDSSDEDQMTFTIQKKTKDSKGNDKYEKQMYIDTNGNLVINGSLRVQSSTTESEKSLDDIMDIAEGAQGESALTVQIESSNGNIFMGNNIKTTLTCHVYYGTKDVTNQVKSFTWMKIDQDGNIDESWNRTMSGNVIELTDADVFNRAGFTCSVDIDL